MAFNRIDIITVDDYKNYQPSVVSIGLSDEQIQDCITTAIDDLSGITNHLIIDVYKYMTELNPNDANNKLWRSATEMDELYRACLSQTHYKISNGNDTSVGDASYNGAGISVSQSLPERNNIGPTVYQHLVAARLIVVEKKPEQYSAFGETQAQHDFKKNPWFDLMLPLFTKTYVPKKWKDFTPNKYLYLNSEGMVVLKDVPSAQKYTAGTNIEITDDNVINCLYDFNWQNIPLGNGLEIDTDGLEIKLSDNSITNVGDLPYAMFRIPDTTTEKNADTVLDIDLTQITGNSTDVIYIEFNHICTYPAHSTAKVAIYSKITGEFLAESEVTNWESGETGTSKKINTRLFTWGEIAPLKNYIDVKLVLTNSALTSTSIESYYVRDIFVNTYKNTDNGLKVNKDVIQEKLIAGDNITIENNVISATGGGGGGTSLNFVNILNTGGTIAITTDNISYDNINFTINGSNYSINNFRLSLNPDVFPVFNNDYDIVINASEYDDNFILIDYNLKTTGFGEYSQLTNLLLLEYMTFVLYITAPHQASQSNDLNNSYLLSGNTVCGVEIRFSGGAENNLSNTQSLYNTYINSEIDKTVIAIGPATDTDAAFVVNPSSETLAINCSKIECSFKVLIRKDLIAA